MSTETCYVCERERASITFREQADGTPLSVCGECWAARATPEVTQELVPALARVTIQQVSTAVGTPAEVEHIAWDAEDNVLTVAYVSATSDGLDSAQLGVVIGSVFEATGGPVLPTPRLLVGVALHPEVGNESAVRWRLDPSWTQEIPIESEAMRDRVGKTAEGGTASEFLEGDIEQEAV